ncbi:glycine--tRNA ligase [bacterium]|nr:glycine--tRNA ligase [bacterium]
MAEDLMNKLIALCKRRGIVFQSSEIYGGISSCWDYGPLGAEIKRNIKDYWWKTMTQFRSDVEGLDSAILMHPKIWEASGHLEHFIDPMVECKKCHQRFKLEDVEGSNCPNCGGEFTEARQFNLMFKTHIGPVEDSSSEIWLRPETAQGIYVNFLNVLSPSRQKIPFGIAQIGKAFRNEITPGNFIFRTREFEQMEMQYFVHPKEADKWLEYWKEQRLKWYDEIGIRSGKLRMHQHGEDELAHYAVSAFDIEYEFPFGWKEVEGIHNRGDFDLTQHTEFSDKKLTYYDDETKERFIPYIIETSGGIDRTVLVTLVDAYEEEPERVVLKLHPRIAPVKAGIFPLVNRDGMPEIAMKITESMKYDFRVFFDKGGAVGRRYRRQDEAGTPYSLTVDSQTLEDETVTIRERDTMEQIRVKIDNLKVKLELLMDNYKRDKGFSVVDEKLFHEGIKQLRE